MKETRTFYESLATLVMDNVREFDVPADNKHRINYCQAWYKKMTLAKREIIVVKSYDTIVAFYDVETDCLVSLGRYSMTTYQHIRKFRNNYLPSMCKTAEINVEFVNWF